MFLPTYFNMQGESLWSGGFALVLIQLAGAVGTLVSGTISDKIGRKKTLLISSATTPIFMLFFMFSSSFFTIPLLILMGFSLFATGPVLLALVHDIKSEHPAFFNGIYMTINFGVSSIAILFFGYFADTFGLQISYFISIGLAFLAIPFLFKL